MSELRKILVCQSPICQDKGAKHILRAVEAAAEQHQRTLPNLRVVTGECPGECEFGPIVQVNDSLTLREVTTEDIAELFATPEQMLGNVLHVLEKDRDVFDRILAGDLY